MLISNPSASAIVAVVFGMMELSITGLGKLWSQGACYVAAGVMATGGDEYFCVITIQNGKPPEIKVDGAGLAAKVSVGNRKFAFDGEKINVQ